MFALGGAVRGGIYGTAPSLDPNSPTLENSGGDVTYETDFRAVYARVLESWLGANSVSILSGDFRAPHPRSSRLGGRPQDHAGRRQRDCRRSPVTPLADPDNGSGIRSRAPRRQHTLAAQERSVREFTQRQPQGERGGWQQRGLPSA